MSIYLIRKNPSDNNQHKTECGINAVLVSATDEASARTLAKANTVMGGISKCADTWEAILVASGVDLPASMQPASWIEGCCLIPGDLTRGGATI